jgi:DNA-binding transcriptional ArsR family regulator
MRRAEAMEAFKALSAPSRMQVFSLLKREGPLSAKEIAGSLGMTAPAVSQHLRAHRAAGLVTSKRRGYWVPYAVDARALSECCGMLIRICACPSCGGDRGAELSDELETLLDRREELLGELQRVEFELEALRE